MLTVILPSQGTSFYREPIRDFNDIQEPMRRGLDVMGERLCPSPITSSISCLSCPAPALMILIQITDTNNYTTLPEKRIEEHKQENGQVYLYE